MKKIIPLILSLALIFSLCACGGGDTSLKDVQSAGKLVIATSPDFPPFESLDESGNVVGIEIDILNKVCEKLGVELAIEQMEAGRSLGMSSKQAMRLIIMPQAMKNILPAIGNEMIALLKETSVAGYVAVVDLTRAGNLIRNNTYDAFNPLMVVALTYLLLVVGLTKLLGVFEKRLHKADRS